MVYNSGSYFLIQISITVWVVFKFTVNFLAKKMNKLHYARRAGIWAYEDNYPKAFGSSSVKLFMESYFDLVICTMINVLALCQAETSEEFNSFFATPLDAACSTISIVLSLLFIVYPIWGALKIRFNQGNLDSKKCRKELGPLLDEIKLDSYHSSMYNVYFMIRRLLTGFGLVILRYHPFFQCYFLMMFSMLNFIY